MEPRLPMNIVMDQSSLSVTVFEMLDLTSTVSVNALAIPFIQTGTHFINEANQVPNLRSYSFKSKNRIKLTKLLTRLSA